MEPVNRVREGFVTNARNSGFWQMLWNHDSSHSASTHAIGSRVSGSRHVTLRLRDVRLSRMMRRSIGVLFVLLAPCLAARAQIPIEWSTCDSAAARARCGTLSVPENHWQPERRRIDLYFAVFPATGGPRESDPVLVLLGGPGDAASRRLAGLARAHASLNVRRDLVLVDQRGTGRSSALNCFLGSDDDLQSYMNEFMPLSSVRDCLTSLRQGADLARYRTVDFVQDLEVLRKSLGVARWNVHGSSYGTRVALQYMARHPDAIRSAVLLGAVPPELTMPVPFGEDADRAVDLVISDCRADSLCAAAFPRLDAELDSLKRRLAEAPASVEISHPVTGTLATVFLTRGTFGEVVRATLYTPAGARMLPLMIHEAFRGDYRAIAAAALRRQRGMALGGWAGLYLAVTCAEDIARADEAATYRANEGSVLGDFRARQHFGACRGWPVRPDGNEWPASRDVPTAMLIVAGEQDPATPPRWSEVVLRRSPKARLIVVPQGGHGFTGMTDATCLSRIEAAFVDAGHPAALDVACVTQMRRQSFVVRRP